MLWTVKLKNYSKHIMNNLVQKSHGKVMIYEVALYGAHQSEKRCPYGQECLGRSELSRSELGWICNPAPMNIRICNPKYTVLTFFQHHRRSYSMVSDCKSDTTANPTQQTQLKSGTGGCLFSQKLP